ncbi:TetR/AcrR family transcriptional regulator [Gordonia sp. NPDC003376]
MTGSLPGRRERKKAATRRAIADSALRLFLERGFDTVGIRDVAADADVAVTTVFSHFASKEALAFEHDVDFEERLVGAIADCSPGESILVPLRREIDALIEHCTGPAAAPYWRMIDGSQSLRDYERSMRLRHAESLGAAIAADLQLPPADVECRAVARFVVDSFSLGRESRQPGQVLDAVFRMIDAAWRVSSAHARESE